MKKTIVRLAMMAAAAISASACLADLNGRVDDLEQQVATVIRSLDELKSYVQAQVYVSGVTDSGDGHILTLSNGETIKIVNGKDGKDGVSVVDGIAGIKSVRIDAEYVVFELEDGGQLALPRSSQKINLEFTECNPGVYGGTAAFAVTGAFDPYVVVYGDSDMEFEVSEIADGKGTISFTAGAKAVTKIYATVIDNASAGANTNTKVLKVNFEARTYDCTLENATMPASGGDVRFCFSTNASYELEFPGWITSAQTKTVSSHSVTMTVSPNEGDLERSGDVVVVDQVKGDVIGTFTVKQRGRKYSLYVLNEGTFGSNNSTLTKIDPAGWTVTESWFTQVNGSALGDVGNDMVLTEDYIIMAINSSNIIQICDREGRAVRQTEEVPAPRRIAVDPSGAYAYVTSYAQDGYVAKIDLATFKVTGTCKTGYEPEGVVCYKGRIYVANTGGYAYSGAHAYEQSISVIDAATMKEVKRVDTGMTNLYGAFIQNEAYPRYVMVNASGDYAATPACSAIFDCETESIIARYDFPATYAAGYGGCFYTLGSSFSFATYAYEYFLKTIDMTSGAPVICDGIVSEAVASTVKSMAAPYGLFFTPTGEIVITDAGDYTNRGFLYRFSKDGEYLSKVTVGVCPGHFACD